MGSKINIMGENSLTDKEKTIKWVEDRIKTTQAEKDEWLQKREVGEMNQIVVMNRIISKGSKMTVYKEMLNFLKTH